MSNVVDIPPERLRCDMPAEVVFEPVDGDVSLPKFRPAAVNLQMDFQMDFADDSSASKAEKHAQQRKR